MGEPVVKRILAALVMADVVGYSRLMEVDEDGTVLRLKQCRTACIEPMVRRYRGRIVDAVGDSMFFEFASAVDATSCAIALQQAMADRGTTVPEDRRIVLRMGINIGDVVIRDRALFGDSVNVAARLQALAGPGGLCLSGAAYDQVRHRLDAAFTPLGPCEVKNISRPIEVFALSSAAIAAMPRPTPGDRPARPRRRLAVVVGAGVLACLLAAGAAFGWSYVRRAGLRNRLDAALSVNQGRLTSRTRATLIERYLAISLHRAFALAPRAQDYWWTGDWASAALAEEKVLERCQIRFGEPCSLAALDDDMLDAGSGAGDTRDMPRLHYGGSFDPAQLPGLRPPVTQRVDVVGYIGSPAPKAAAIHPHGILSIVTGATTQRQAEIQALRSCNEQSSKDENGDCLLYAVGDRVVLPSRATAAISRP